MFVLEPGMTFTSEFNVLTEALTIFNPFNGAVLMTIPRITNEAARYIMDRLNSGSSHIHSQWVWHGSHGVYVPVIK
jgi:hypothetical protein